MSRHLLKLTLPLLPRNSCAYDFVAVGESSLDTVCVVSGFPGPDEKQPAIRRMDLPGGQAATAAVACRRLGWRSKYIGSIGDDEAGSTIRANLIREGVECVAVEKNGVPSRTAVVIVDEASGRRIVLECRDPRLNLGDDDVDPRHFTSGRILLIDGTDSATSIRAASLARAAGVRTIVDIDSIGPASMALLELIDVVIVPGRFAVAATGVSDLVAASSALADHLRSPVVILTAGEQGALLCSGGQTVVVKASEAEVADTTGAGDAFRAGFAAAWLNSRGNSPDLIDMVEFAARVAAMNCRAYGAQAGLPMSHELPLRQGGPV